MQRKKYIRKPVKPETYDAIVMTETGTLGTGEKAVTFKPGDAVLINKDNKEVFVTAEQLAAQFKEVVPRVRSEASA